MSSGDQNVEREPGFRERNQPVEYLLHRITLASEATLAAVAELRDMVKAFVEPGNEPLTALQVTVMHALSAYQGEREGMAVVEVAEAVSRDRANINRVLVGLADRGLVAATRQSHPRLFLLSEAGAELLARYHSVKP